MNKKLKATVFISGACPQHIYGTNLANLERRAIKLLTEHGPIGGLVPDKINICEHVCTIDGNTARWSPPVKTILLKDVPEDQHEYIQRRRTREAEARESADFLNSAKELRDMWANRPEGEGAWYSISHPW